MRIRLRYQWDKPWRSSHWRVVGVSPRVMKPRFRAPITKLCEPFFLYAEVLKTMEMLSGTAKQ